MTQLKPIDMNTRWSAANLPVQTWGRRLEDFRPYDEDTREALAVVMDFVDHFETRLWSDKTSARRAPHHLTGRGLLLVGSPGTGKTLLACMALTEVHLQHKRDIRFVAFANYIRAVTESFSVRKHADMGIHEAVRQFYAFEKQSLLVRHRPLVVLDDVGKEHHTATGYAQDIFDQLLRDRFRDGLPTIITTNVALKEWSATYNPSMRSFIDEAYDTIVLSGRDQRRRSA